MRLITAIILRCTAAVRLRTAIIRLITAVCQQQYYSYATVVQPTHNYSYTTGNRRQSLYTSSIFTAISRHLWLLIIAIYCDKQRYTAIWVAIFLIGVEEITIICIPVTTKDKYQIYKIGSDQLYIIPKNITVDMQAYLKLKLNLYMIFYNIIRVNDVLPMFFKCKCSLSSHILPRNHR